MNTKRIPFPVYGPLALNASGDGVAVTTATGTVTLTWRDESIQNIDPGGAGRDVALPTPDENHKGCFFVIYNAADAAETLTVKSGVSTIVALGQGESALVACTATAWKLGLGLPASTALPGSANTWDLLQTFTVGALIQDSGYLAFGTPGTDLVLTADGTDVVVTSTGDLVFNDSVDLKIGTGKDIGIAWDGTRLNVTQAAANSEIRWGVDGAGIDQRWYTDTASSYFLIDQSADALIRGGAVVDLYTQAGTGTGTKIAVIGPDLTHGMVTTVYEATVSPNAVETALFTVPANSVIDAVQANVESSLTGGGTTVTFSIGVTGDVDAYGTAGSPTDALVKNTKLDYMGAGNPPGAGASLGVFSKSTVALKLIGAATGGTSAGNTALTVGSVKVRVVYRTLLSYVDAA